MTRQTLCRLVPLIAALAASAACAGAADGSLSSSANAASDLPDRIALDEFPGPFFSDSARSVVITESDPTNPEEILVFGVDVSTGVVNYQLTASRDRFPEVQVLASQELANRGFKDPRCGVILGISNPPPIPAVTPRGDDVTARAGHVAEISCP